jgi:phosphatidylserine synthase
MESPKVYSHGLEAIVVLIVVLSFLVLGQSEFVRSFTHDTLALIGFLGSVYMAHTDPLPEMRRRRFLIVVAAILAMSMVTA